MVKTECVIEYKRDGTSGHIFTMTDEGVPIFQVKNVELSPEGRKHWANRMLNAAALCCICTTFASDLIKRGVEIKSLTGKSASSKEKDSVLRTHINEIEVEIEVDIGEADQALMDECVDIVNNDTLVMYSLREGVDVQASIKRVK